MDLLLQSTEPKSEINRKINKGLNSKPDNLWQEYKHLDMSNLIAPYYVNPHQRQMLKNIIGTKNVEDIEMLNALVYAGIINVDCPPLGQSSLNEKYVDPVSGHIQCRRGVNWNKLQKTVPNPNKTCPPPDNPMAIEKYVNALNEVDCRPPVIRGQFSCPPGVIHDGIDMDPRATYMQNMTLSDGTGTCVKPYGVGSVGLYPSDVSRPMAMNGPEQLLYGKSIYEKIQNYVSIFDDIGLNVDLIEPLNKMIKESPYLGDFRAKFLKQPSLIPLQTLLPHVNTDDDMRILNTALYEYLRKKHPGYIQSKKLSYGGFMGMTGGARRRKRKSKKRKSRKRKSRKRKSRKRKSKKRKSKKRKSRKRKSKKRKSRK